MSLISRMVGPRKNVAFSEPFWADLFGSFRSRSGKSVNVKSALEVTAVLACVRVIAEGISQVPLKLYRERPGGGSDPARDHPLYRVLYLRPNPWQTSFEFRESLIFHTVLTGNFFAFINKTRGQVTELIPLDPGSVTVYRGARGVLSYSVAPQIEEPSSEDYGEMQRPGFGEGKVFPAETIWHVRGPSWNTWMGMPAVRLAREAIGLAMATEEAHALLHANGGQTTGLYSVEGKLDDKQRRTLRDYVEYCMMAANKFKPFILDNNAKFTPTSMTGVDAQHIETRKHQVEEICRAFRVMPIMIGQADKAATYASAEQMFLAHVIHCIAPWTTRIQQSINANLLTEEEQESGLYAKFNLNALMHGAARDRSEFYYKLWQMGVLCPNEIRALEEMNPYEGGEKYYVAQNIVPVDERTGNGGPNEEEREKPALLPFRK